MNYTLLQILSILENSNITIESKYLQINNSLIEVKNLSYYYQDHFYNDLNKYLIDNPLISIPLAIHFPLFIGTSVEKSILHYVNEYQKINFTHYYLLDPTISNYGSEYILDWISQINIQYFNHISDPSILKYSYILEKILKYINTITKNSKYGEYLYNKNNTLGLIDIIIENNMLFNYIELFMLNTYAEYHPVLEIIITEIIAQVISGYDMDTIISSNLEFFEKNLLSIGCLEYEISILNYNHVSQSIKAVCTFIIANILNNVILDYRYFLGMDHNFLLYISQLKYF